MKNANVFVDVDLTLVDANGKLFDGAPEALLALKDAGCHFSVVNGRSRLLPQGC
jgi:hydroxymethylpyrimidine pyrophosphatase-like HAD family hydrolase